MANSISLLQESAETAGIADWENYSSLPKHLQYSRIQSLRDPLKHTSFRSEEIEAVYGYRVVGDSAYLVYFWENSFGSLRWKNDEVFSSSGLLNTYLRLGMVLSKAHSLNPTMKTFANMFEQEVGGALGNLSDIKTKLNLYWSQPYDDPIRFVCLYVEKGEDGCEDLKHSSSSSLLECLAFHRDYFYYRSPIWQAVPMSYLIKNSPGNLNDLVKLHLHPKCYNPFKYPSNGQYLWPWQKCIVKRVPNGNLELDETDPLHYKPIRTTSLVFDIRKSTIAMEQLPGDELGEYSPFINEIVKVATDTILEYGGFFDKETGDGIVAHFIDFSDLYGELSTKNNSRLRAFNASMKIINHVSTICEEFQEKLDLGIEKLGASVGLHEGMSVWLSEQNQIRAIGDSVVLASRLANEAKTRSIFVSNSFFRKLSPLIQADLNSKFEKKIYTGKEYRGKPNLFGYEIEV